MRQRFKTLLSPHRLLPSLAKDRRGSVIVIFAITLPIVVMAIAGAINFASSLHQKSRLQSIVDAAAIAAASELSLSNASTTNVSSVVQAIAERYFKATQTSKFSSAPQVSTSVGTSPLQVKVSATQDLISTFGTFGYGTKTVTATATAQVVGRPNICVLALHPSTNGALSLEQRARVTGDDCGVYSNSTHNIGIKTKNSAVLKAATICSAGGVQGTGHGFDPPPYLDCPTFKDPLAARPEPSVGVCTTSKVTVIKTSQKLLPGTYCGLTVTNGASVELAPGIFVFKDAPLIVNKGARLSGKKVGLFATGKGAYFEFDGDSIISLEAPTTGTMAGLLLFSARNTTRGAQHKLYSENAHVMVGTIYIPTGELRLDGSAAVGGKSAYTAVVAETIRLYGGPHIVLNTRYSDTEVPVPDGIKGAGQPIQLIN